MLLVPFIKREPPSYYKLSYSIFFVTLKTSEIIFLEKPFFFVICNKLVFFSYPKVTMLVLEVGRFLNITSNGKICLPLTNNKKYYNFQIVQQLLFLPFVHPFISSLAIDIATLLRIISDLLRIFRYISA